MKFPPIYRKIKKIIEQKRLYRKYQPTLEKNRGLKNIHKGKRCFIIGTGPSINNQDLAKLKNEYTFAVNTFWNYPRYKEISPKYYVLTDSDLFPNKQGRGELWQTEILKKTPVIESCSDTKLFLHITGKTFIEENGLFRNNEIYYLAFNGHFRDNLNFNIDLDKVIPNTKNVMVASIIAAVYMGFEEIYLLGCEHSFLAQPAQDYYRKFKEFYKTEYDDNDQGQKIKYAMDIMSYESHIHHIQVLFKNYRLLREKLAQEKPTVKIYNATPNSFLDVFPFVKYEDII